MKRKLLLLSVLVICIATFTTGTLAFQLSDGKAHNVITTGGVEIALQEWADDEKTKPFQDLGGIKPATSATKIVEVKNTGKAYAWIRVKVEKNIQLDENNAQNVSITPNTDLLTLDFNTTDWISGGDGYYYYKDKLTPGAVTEPLFTTVTFDKTMGNEYCGASISVKVNAQAVQSDNNGTAVTDAAEWPSN